MVIPPLRGLSAESKKENKSSASSASAVNREIDDALLRGIIKSPFLRVLVD
jgi:hypothetical protein